MAHQAEGHVAGMGEAMKQAEAGLKLFAQEVAAEFDKPAAEAYKTEIEAQIKALEDEVAMLTGKDNKKARQDKSKQVSEIKVQPQYIDACKVVKGQEPKNGFFVVKSATKEEVKPAAAPEEAPKEEAKKDAKKDEKKSKKQESAGISADERKELDKLKEDIISRKSELKATGMSGGQCNKDEQVVAMVARMNELKEKECPGSTGKDDKKDDKKKSKAPLSQEEMAQCESLRGEIDTYKHKLKAEFGYSNKDIKADPDLAEMEAKLAALEKRGGK
jgi:hypothetical protein